MFILDTNVVSELRKVATGSQRVKSWVRDQVPTALYLSAITVLEIQRGIALLEQRGDQLQANLFNGWLNDQLLVAFAGRVLACDGAVALRAGRLPWRDSKDYRDPLIAATALEHHGAVVTRNVKHFRPLGVKVLNPWQPVSARDS